MNFLPGPRYQAIVWENERPCQRGPPQGPQGGSGSNSALGSPCRVPAPQDTSGCRAAHQARQSVNESRVCGSVIKSLGALGFILVLNQI